MHNDENRHGDPDKSWDDQQNTPEKVSSHDVVIT